MRKFLPKIFTLQDYFTKELILSSNKVERWALGLARAR